MSLESAVGDVRDFDSLIDLLSDELNWPIDATTPREELTFDWAADELQLSEGATRRLAGGVVRQLRGMKPDQPWGIFLIEFNQPRLYATALRRILRGLVPNRRRDSRLPCWKHDNLLFVCVTADYQQFTFAHFRGVKAHAAKLATFSWKQGDRHVRTLCEFNLPALRWPEDDGSRLVGTEAWLRKWQTAWDVEKVTKKFFGEYRQVFEKFEGFIHGVPEGEERRMFTQTLFNRLLFCWFLQKKGWLNHDARYLSRLLEVARDHASKPGSRPERRHNFYDDYLYPLFFWAMNAPMDQRRTDEASIVLEDQIGRVPFLNGGLFEQQSAYDFPDKVRIPNDAFTMIFDLFERYNFTVTESTPFDVEVAIDPEMLGKVFEELVTGRHETGSYYTPRPVVSFMCREALKHHLATIVGVDANQPGPGTGGLTSTPTPVARFVDDADPSDLPNPETVLDALKSVKVCDPACGSGAYLLGMMQELLRLREALFAAKVKDYRTLYERKLDIIQSNLYGVDKDPFATNIAMLRLWLSLVVDDTRDPLDDPEVDVSLPNLVYRIECGDSLTAPDPQGIVTGGMFRHRALTLAEDLAHLKARYMRSTGTEKKSLGDQIGEHEQELAAALNDSGNPSAPDGALDWRIAFAEVFTHTSVGAISKNAHPKHIPDLATSRDRPREGAGFDIVITNPPYVGHRTNTEFRPVLKPLYEHVYHARGDLYVYFYARAHQLLRQGGIGCFISSNKWLRAAYGEKLRQLLLDGQAFHLFVDFGELPVFRAATFPAISLWQKQPRGSTSTTWSVVNNLRACYDEGLREHITRIARTVPASQFGEGKPRVASSAAAERREKMEASGQRLGELVKERMYRGITTGLNDAFIVDRPTYDILVTEDPKCTEIVKPILSGDDVRCYEIHSRDQFLIYIPWEMEIEAYPSVLKHLLSHRARLTNRIEVEQGRHPWYALSRYASGFAHLFNCPKVLVPAFAMSPRFAMDRGTYFFLAPAYFIASDDMYLLAVLNSNVAFELLLELCSVLGDQEAKGRAVLRPVYFEKLPVPDASTRDREAVAKLAREAQRLHTERRQRVEQFLRDLGTSPAESSSRNPLEQPWTLTPEEFTKRAGKHGAPDLRLFTTVRDETAALTEAITKVEREIDERVAGLYGVELGDCR